MPAPSTISGAVVSDLELANIHEALAEFRNAAMILDIQSLEAIHDQLLIARERAWEVSKLIRATWATANLRAKPVAAQRTPELDLEELGLL